MEVKDGCVEDDNVGKFYTKFAPTRVDENDLPLVSYSKEEALSIYYHQILHLEDPNKGGKFFNYIDDTSFPHLKDDVRKLLFDYVVCQLPSEKATLLDKEFFDYFYVFFNDAANLLIKDKEYSAAYASFSACHERLLRFDYLSTYVSYLIGIVVIGLIVPLFLKNGRSFSNLLTKTYYVNEDDEFTPTNYLLRFLAYILKSYWLIFPLGMISSMYVVTTNIFVIGGFGINNLLFIGISVIISIFSILTSLLTKEHRNFDALLSLTTMCERHVMSSQHTPSNTVSE